jgi:purine nucleoside phosphorylase
MQLAAASCADRPRASEFVDLSDAYSLGLRENSRRAAGKTDMILHKGVYAGVISPNQERS